MTSPDAGTERSRDAVHERLLAIWNEALDRHDVGIDDDFLDLGGDSISGAEITTRVGMAFGLVVPVSLLFRASTVARLADWLESARALGAPEFTPFAHVPRPPRLPLALAQERLWFLSQMEGVSEAYH